MAEERVHDLLPWYVSRTLPPAEKGMFEAHLPACGPCQEEVAMLEKLRVQLEEHGESFLAEHPPPEELVALLLPGQANVDANRARELQRHLALCPTCAEEASWLRGEAVAASAGPPPVSARPVRPRTWIGWVSAAAAVLLLVVGLARVRGLGPAELDSDVLALHLIEATQRADGQPTQVRVPPEARSFHLLLEIDLPPAEFPAALEIEGPGGTRVYRKDRIDAADVYSERFLFLRLRREELPDGLYVARLASARHPAAPTAYPFRVSGAPSETRP